ncbi:MAG: AMP-binding protein [Phycisphaerae bacterium]|nr:AMP-binding protein [Phycisphaerae bacterium]
MLVESLLASADKFPEKLAVADMLGMEMTYSRLVRIASVMKRVVEAQTNCPRVGIFLPSSAGFAVSYYGVLWAGRAAVPLNLLLRPEELQKIVEDAGLDTVITLRFPEDVAHLNETVRQLPVQNKIILNDLGLKRRVIFSYLRPQPRSPRAAPDDVATLLYTSGTSGDPKGVMLTQENLDRNARGAIELEDPKGEQHFLGVLPLFHSFGLTTMLLVPLTLGAEVFFMPRFIPSAVVRVIEQRRITMIYAIASMYSAMLRVKNARPDHFKSVQCAVSGGEALPPALYEAWLEKFGFPLLEGYGLTETSPVVCANRPWDNRPGTAGQIMEGVEVRTVEDDRSPLPPGQIGEIAVRGHCVMKGYYNKPKETAEVIDDQGWFYTGDMGRVSEDNYLAITGRKKEMIIVSGENIYPREIETILEKHPAVAESAVIAEKVGGTRGEVPVGFVVLKEGQTVTDAELRDHCREHLPQYKVPKKVWIAEDLPRGPTGKILKRALDPGGPEKSGESLGTPPKISAAEE